MNMHVPFIDITCPILQSPADGFITFTEGSSSSLQFMINATYGCNPGYGLSGGDRMRTCVGSTAGPGEWSGTAPICIGIVCI